MTQRPRVLLVEDNPITRKLVRFALQQQDIDLTEAVDGTTAIELAQQHRPDLILQDLVLPDMDGFRLVTALRALPELRTVPVLAFSGLLSQPDEKRIAGAGFTDFVTKPVEPSKLVRIIRAHLPSGELPTSAFGRGRRIVLVDDDDVQRKLSVFKLTRLGFTVVDAADGRAGLDAARAQPPAAIITDAMMPGLDGFGLCAEVRKDPALKDVPIVMLTSTYVDDADRELGQLAGANEFVIRTPALREMITALEHVLAPSAVTVAPAAPKAPDFEREHASRTLVQLERQAAAASSARQQCATLSAELSVLNAISEAITQHSDIDLVLREILAACCDAGGVSLGALSLANDDGSFRTVLVGSINGLAGDDWFISDGDFLKRFIGERGAVIVNRDAAEPDVRHWMEQRGLQTAVIVTLQHKDDTLGALVMLSEGRDLATEDRLLFAEAVGHQVSVALALAQAFDDTATAAQVAREHARLLQSVFTTISDPIMVVDANGQASTWNAALDALIPMPPQPPLSVRDPRWSAHCGAFASDKTTLLNTDELPLARALRGENVDNVDVFLKNAQKPEGAWLRANARALRDDSGAVAGAVAVARDITKERLASEQLMVSDRMASIGLMAAGVGHEINNPLSAVVANRERASAEVDALMTRVGRAQLGDLPEEIREALEAAERVRRIALDLKLFSGGQADDNGAVDVERVLDSSLRMAWSQVRQRARVVKQYGRVPLVGAAEGRLGQVFLNLIVNAAQAIPEGDVERQEIRLRTSVDPEGRVVVSVHDTGSGIPASVMAQLFTPFVTTKPAGVGSGLGLSICQRLVTAMGGSIWAESAVGRGTVFHVALRPASIKPAATPAAVTARPAGVGHARILVVDDEEMIGMLLRRVLKAHEVTVLANAKDALAVIADGARYDAILCDLNMPVMSGIEFYENLSRRFPDQARAVIFLTGGAHNKETLAFLDTVTNMQLDKPFDAVKLRERVDAHLAARSASAHPPEAA
jgi:CheY-like chemotaxis protein